MEQHFCPGCKRIYFGSYHNCLRHFDLPKNIVIAPTCQSLAATLDDTDQSAWFRDVRKVCNHRCKHWGKRAGSIGCLLSPTKPCDIHTLYLPKGMGCLDKDAPKFGPRPEPEPIKFPEFRFGSGSGDRAIITVAVGDEATELAKYTLAPMQRYADKCGAELVVVDQDQFPNWPIANKFCVSDIAQRYGRSAFIDIDCYIRESTPDLFDQCEPGSIWMHRDLPYTRSQRFLQRDAKHLGSKEFIECWNTGVVVMDREHWPVWLPPDHISQTSHTLEQTSIEVKIKTAGIPLRPLPITLNCQWWMHGAFLDNIERSHIIHIAGAKHPTRVAMLKMLATESRTSTLKSIVGTDGNSEDVEASQDQRHERPEEKQVSKPAPDLAHVEFVGTDATEE